MRTSDILALKPKVLNQHDRKFYVDQGYLIMPQLVDEKQLIALHQIIAEIVDKSRSVSSSSNRMDLEKGHCFESPKLRRVTYADDEYEELWVLCSNSVITDVAEDLLGPNVRFRDLMLNFKWADGGAEVKWHQDFAFYPHTHTGTLQFLLFLDDVSSEQGPLQIIPVSHKGEVFRHYDEQQNWTGAIASELLKECGLQIAVEVVGAAGTVSVHHSCTIHGSSQNMSNRGRPALVLTYSAADAVAYTAPPYPGSHYGEIVRGKEPGFAHHEELYVPLPPDWSDGYTSIYTHQED
ncbi:MAG: ectoine hydroxylase [Parasphingorhabdus sp.]|jgi:ectoine hydroxylase